jgi:hypothetical protein
MAEAKLAASSSSTSRLNVPIGYLRADSPASSVEKISSVRSLVVSTCETRWVASLCARDYAAIS